LKFRDFAVRFDSRFNILLFTWTFDWTAYGPNFALFRRIR